MAEEDYDDIIAFTLGKAIGGCALVIIPGADLAFMSVNWGMMLGQIARRAGKTLDPAMARKIVPACITNVGVYWVGTRIFTAIFSKIPFTLPAAVSVNAVINGVFTLRLGRTMIELAEKDSFNLNDLGYMYEYFTNALKPRPTRDEIDWVVRMWQRARQQGR